MRCLICNKKFNHPIRSGKRAKFCGPKCRAKHKKEWHRAYDAQEHIKAAKRVRESARWYREHPRVES